MPSAFYKDLVDAANERLLDDKQTYFELEYASRRAVGRRILQSQNRANKYLDHKNPDSWEAIVDLSIAASIRGDDADSEQEKRSTICEDEN
ncbi:MAG: hypothetical protein SGARI_005396 [Bacillariaceae sp.]